MIHLRRRGTVIAVTAQITYNEKGLVGGVVILPCDYNQTTDGNILAVTWTVTMEDSTVNLGLYIKTGGTTDNQITPPAEYDGRVELVDDVKLKLTGVTPEDERQYKCTVAASLHIKTSFINLHLLVPTNTTPNNPVPVGVRGDCFGSAAVAGAAVGCLTAGVLLGGAAVFMLLHFRKAHVHRKMNPTEGDMLDDGQYEDVRPGTGTGNEVTMATFHQPSQPPQPSAQYQELRPAVYQSLQRD
ncbi:uncharacterized protein LOC118412194 [Branchiostoma floridae]|uniref:Uncharacterized protein LOC118412194 n=1 Tax=Branchiostoma floridae TaxID=7739 RepID=A0A9J7KW06_BRAFL|nr:uncharacterized protein LOC118412194 [Branchiostoma floridae]